MCSKPTAEFIEELRDSFIGVRIRLFEFLILVQQRIVIARALLNSPSLILADEPTGNLDPDTAWEIMKLINQINRRGTTVVMVTHAKEIVDRMGKRIIAIDNGKLVRDSREGAYGYDD